MTSPLALGVLFANRRCSTAENAWRSHKLSWHLQLWALPAQWETQRIPPAIPWQGALLGGSLILLHRGQWQPQHLTVDLWQIFSGSFNHVAFWFWWSLLWLLYSLCDLKGEHLLLGAQEYKCHMFHSKWLGAAVASSCSCIWEKTDSFGYLSLHSCQNFILRCLSEWIWVLQLTEWQECEWCHKYKCGLWSLQLIMKSKVYDLQQHQQRAEFQWLAAQLFL